MTHHETRVTQISPFPTLFLSLCTPHLRPHISLSPFLPFLLNNSSFLLPSISSLSRFFLPPFLTTILLFNPPSLFSFITIIISIIHGLMESLQVPINSFFLADHLDLEFLTFEQQQEEFEERIPFLQMLQTVESPSNFSLQEPNFQTLLKLQHLKKQPPWEIQIQATEHESCISHENQSSSAKQCATKSPIHKERRKRKRTRPIKNKEEVESQRMTHIAVERNRRRQMNDHLTALRSLMPPSYLLRGDQASIIGGAIDFVKELEQLLQSLEAQKRINSGEIGVFSPAPAPAPEENCGMEEFTTENKTDTAEIGVTVIQSHVNLKIQCEKKTCQLLKTIVALEELKFTILHLNITSSQSSVLYTFNLKIEDECKLGTSDEIAAAVHQVFSR